MTARASEERRFIDAADGLEFGARDLSGLFDAFDAWLAERETSLREARLGTDGLHEGSALARQGAAIDAVLRAAAPACARPWTSIEAARSLAGQFEDRAMLLVFGKFNAGKSSFCNFLADRFAAHGKAVRYFRVEAGRLVASAGRFREGEIETTAQLQGVYLGARLVLLDTPGLHSVTPDNAALTRRFVESADGVIWLTSSASPGQVQELDDLGLELHRGKPLLPVLTRSDEYEEDERDGRLVRQLANKSATRRALQEADVTARAADKLAALGVDASRLAAPVSVSVRMAREPAAPEVADGAGVDADREALAAAGFERLYAALHALSGPALAYKRRKHAEVALHHLDENLSRALHDELRPMLARLTTLVHEAAGRLDAQQAQSRREIVRRVLPALPRALDAHAAARDVPALCRSVAAALDAALVDAIAAQFGDYLIVPGPPDARDASGARIELRDGAGYEERVVGDAGERIEVDYQRLYTALREAVLERATLAADHAAGQARAAIERLLERARRLERVLEQGARRLDALGRELRAAPARPAAGLAATHAPGR